MSQMFKTRVSEKYKRCFQRTIYFGIQVHRILKVGKILVVTWYHFLTRAQGALVTWLQCHS